MAQPGDGQLRRRTRQLRAHVGGGKRLTAPTGQNDQLSALLDDYRHRATATLEVDFGDGTATGEIDGYTVGGAAKDWTEELGSAAIGTHCTIASGGADTAETTAAWSGRFHEADLDTIPAAATGAFGTTGQPH